MKCTAVIFDLFHTLVEGFSIDQHRKTLDAMAEALSISPDDLHSGWGDTSNGIETVVPTIEARIVSTCRLLGVAPSRQQIEAAVDRRTTFTRRALRPRHDAVETVSRLRRLGMKIGLISNCSPEVPLLWGELELAKLVDEALFSCEVGVRKPDPRMYLIMCDRLGVSPEECVYVGDGAGNELAGAAQVGMSPVLMQVPDDGIPRPGLDEWDGPTICALGELT